MRTMDKLISSYGKTHAADYYRLYLVTRQLVTKLC
jgi:hypothetical protein